MLKQGQRRKSLLKKKFDLFKNSLQANYNKIIIISTEIEFLQSWGVPCKYLFRIQGKVNFVHLH